MNMVLTSVMNWGVYSTKPKSLYIGQVIPGAVDWTSTIRAKYSGLLWGTAEFLE
jgi:hypothetical protein